MTTKLRAFHGKKSVKTKYLNRIIAHRKADQIVHGQYWNDGKGCAVGCTVHSDRHSSYETELGIPTILAHLEDTIFESLSNGDSMTWPERFLLAPKVGADLSMVWPRFAHWLLVDQKDGVLRFAIKAKDERCEKAISDVAALYAEWFKTKKKPEQSRWDAARDAARAAARDAAGAAAWAVARAAARDAAGAAAWAVARDAARDAAGAAARAVARDAARDAAGAAARAAHWQRMSEKLLELMADAPLLK